MGPAPQSTCESEVDAQVMVLKEAIFTSRIFEGDQTRWTNLTITDNKAAHDIIRTRRNEEHTCLTSALCARTLLAERINIILTTTDRMMGDIHEGIGQDDLSAMPRIHHESRPA